MLNIFRATKSWELSPQDVNLRREREGSVLVDVREQGEWAEGHISGALHIPLAELEGRISELPAETAVIFYCRSGARSATARELARRVAGRDDHHLKGGIMAWRAAGLPIEWR